MQKIFLGPNRYLIQAQLAHFKTTSTGTCLAVSEKGCCHLQKIDTVIFRSRFPITITDKFSLKFYSKFAKYIKSPDNVKYGNFTGMR